MISTALNVGLCYLTTSKSLPLYFDTIGTIFMAFMAGYLPAIGVAVMTSLLCSLFSKDALYFALLGVFVAIRSDAFIRNRKGGLKAFVCLICDATIMTGVVGTIMQWLLLGKPQYAYVSDPAGVMADGNKALLFFFSMIIVMGFNLLEKGISILIAYRVYLLVPPEARKKFRASRWKQKPLSRKETKEITSNVSEGSTSLKIKVLFLLMSVVIPLTIILGIITTRTNYNYIKDDGKKMVSDVTAYAASTLDPEHFGKFLVDAKKVSEYGNIRYMQYNTQLINIKNAFPEIEYLYVYQIKEDACYLIFDTDPDSQKNGTVGERVEFDDTFRPLIDDLVNGRQIEPLEVDSRYGIFITAYHPINDSEGRPTNFYVGADITLKTYQDYAMEFILKVAFASSGFFAMIIAFGLWTSSHQLVYPIGSLVNSIDGFMKGFTDQEKLDESVKKLESLDIRTGDELEKLYRAVCEMANQTAEQMRSNRLLVRSNEKMQTGLIVTMADIFENQNIDSKAHVQKTAEYVRIILESLRRKGYYTEKISDKYINDVEMSAPLYDIGKVKIPDSILNKPGELTGDEREIMKTHTTEGRKILENAIATVEGENYLKEARNMAAYHHEHWDGSGYPLGLHGEVIPLSARIMAIADAFDEMTSPRRYRTAISAQEALDKIKEGAGSQFDPRCVEAFADSFTEVKGVIRKYPE
jgi:response regulator RpfG family c-di-GMP phosphodiesterase